MNSIPINILVCGLGWSGSGTIVGLLSEYDNVTQIPGGPIEIAPTGYEKMGEFDYFRSPGFIGDFLEMNDVYFKPNHFIDRLKSRKIRIYYETLKNLKKCRTFRNIKTTLSNRQQVLKIHNLLSKLAVDLLHTESEDKRLELSREWLAKAVQISGANKNHKAVVLDQPIHLNQHNNVWAKLFEPFKVIFVIRDPRDILAEQAKHYSLFRQQMNSNIICIYGSRMEDSLRFNSDSLLARMEQIDKLISKFDSSEIMIISFEELVSNYDTSKKIIESFVGLDEKNHTSQYKYFNPEWSVKNMGVYKNCEVQILEAEMEKMQDWYKSKLQLINNNL